MIGDAITRAMREQRDRDARRLANIPRHRDAFLGTATHSSPGGGGDGRSTATADSATQASSTRVAETGDYRS